MLPSGIYAIENLENGKRYYGSTHSFRHRKASHWCALRHGKHPNRHLQSAWDLYGDGAFRFVILKRCPVEELLVTEDEYLASNADGYNIERIARRHGTSPETRAKLIAARRRRTISPETRAKISATLMGTHRPPEVRAKIAAGKQGKPGTGGRKPGPQGPLSEAHRAKISAAMTPEVRERISAALRSRHKSEETRARMREAIALRKLQTT